MKDFFFKIIFIVFICSTAASQPDSRFRPFDWILYKGSGSITSITEGFNFAYIGTELGGLKRFNLFGDYFDDPITTAQGLKSNHITATYFDKKTGLLWTATPKYIQYSFSREGDWFTYELNSLGLSNSDQIKRIGSSNKYIWLQARSSYVKLDQLSGMLIGIYATPDELSVKWGSEGYNNKSNLNNILLDYHILEDWVFNGNRLINGMGKTLAITTGFIGNQGKVYVGTDDGTLFYGTTTMEIFSPISTSIINTDINTIFDDDEYFWIGSQDYITSRGISKLNMHTKISQIYSFDETINMTPTPIYSLYSTDSQLWAGGNSLILYFDFRKNYWRTIGEERGVPGGKIWDLDVTSKHVWVGSSMGLSRIECSTQSYDPSGIESFFHQIPVYDIEFIEEDIWIGARSGLFIYSDKNPQLVSALNYGSKKFPEQFSNITAIEKFNRLVYVAGDMGIVKLDLDEKEWKIVCNPALYQNKIIYSLAANDKYLFLGTDSGLLRINNRTGLIKDYLFSFIGQVNEIILQRNIIWLGTNNGLIRFKWKKDL